MFYDRDEPRERPRGQRSIILRLLLLLAFAVFIAQLWRLQIVEGATYLKKAENNRVRIGALAPPRGLIYDRHGRKLAENAPIFVVSVVPADLPSKQEGQVYERLAALVGVPADRIARAVEQRRANGDIFTPVPVKYNVDRTAVMRLREHGLELPGVVVDVESTRRYPAGELLAHVVGYLGPIPADELKQYTERGYSPNERVGVAGIEATFEDALHGRPGRVLYEVNVAGQRVATLGEEPPESGHNLYLTIDLDLQRMAAYYLRAGLKDSPSGVAIIMDPKTGEVLALVSVPSFDNNVFGDDAREEELEALLRDTERKPFFHRAIQGAYAPGSTFKLITGAGALQEGIATRDTVIESKGAIYVPSDLNPNYRQRFPDWATLGRLNFVEAIANSSNVYFFYLGGGFEPEGFVGLGNDRLAHYARQFGYGAPTGIELDGEAAGTIPDESWKLSRLGERWVKGDTYNMAIGQGFVQATPLQVANATNAIANGGTLYRPRLARELRADDGRVVRRFGPEVLRSVGVEDRHLAVLREGMEAGFHIGTLLVDYRIPDLRVAGKTGTGEFFGPRDAKGNLPTHGWFTGFAPADDPQISVTVFVERGTGSKDAAPIALEIIRAYFGKQDQRWNRPT